MRASDRARVKADQDRRLQENRARVETLRSELYTPEMARNEVEAPMRAAEKALATTAGKLLILEKESIFKSSEDRWIDPACPQTMSWDECHKYNEKSFLDFLAETPEYFPCPENAQNLINYFSARSLEIVSKEMFSRAYSKLKELGLITAKPASEPTPEPVEVAPARPDMLVDEHGNEYFNIETYQWYSPLAKPSDRISGFDWTKSGERRTFSRLEVNALSSDDYLKFTQFGRMSSARMRNI